MSETRAYFTHDPRGPHLTDGEERDLLQALGRLLAAERSGDAQRWLFATGALIAGDHRAAIEWSGNRPTDASNRVWYPDNLQLAQAWWDLLHDLTYRREDALAEPTP